MTLRGFSPTGKWRASSNGHTPSYILPAQTIYIRRLIYFRQFQPYQTRAPFHISHGRYLLSSRRAPTCHEVYYLTISPYRPIYCISPASGHAMRLALTGTSYHAAFRADIESFAPFWRDFSSRCKSRDRDMPPATYDVFMPPFFPAFPFLDYALASAARACGHEAHHFSIIFAIGATH